MVYSEDQERELFLMPLQDSSKLAGDWLDDFESYMGLAAAMIRGEYQQIGNTKSFEVHRFGRGKEINVNNLRNQRPRAGIFRISG